MIAYNLSLVWYLYQEHTYTEYWCIELKLKKGIDNAYIYIKYKISYTSIDVIVDILYSTKNYFQTNLRRANRAPYLRTSAARFQTPTQSYIDPLVTKIVIYPYLLDLYRTHLWHVSIAYHLKDYGFLGWYTNFIKLAMSESCYW